MPPATSRDFQRVAAQRLTEAETLARIDLTLLAQYIGGYTIECSLKALILRTTPQAEQAQVLATITAGKRMHQFDVLAELLRKREVELPREIARRLARFGWDTALRYETGRLDLSETTGLLRTAKMVYDWVEGQLP